MATANVCEFRFTASVPSEEASNARTETQFPGPLMKAANFDVTGADTYELSTNPAPVFCTVGAVSGTLYVKSGVSGGSIAAGEGKWIPEGSERPILVEKGHTHLLFFGV